jgi:flagellar L-ring protein precursor FlgH
MRFLLLISLPAMLCAQTVSSTGSAIPGAPSPGSLFSAGGLLADSGRDLRASRVDDLLTIIVSENVSAVATGTTATSRKTSAADQVTALGGALGGPAVAKYGNLLGLTGDHELAGTGSTTRNMTVATTLSARVTEVKPNGDLVVEATKDIAVNSEKQNIVVRGVVRQADLSVANTVPSQLVADLQVHINGKGVVGDAIKRPNVFYRMLLGILPF